MSDQSTTLAANGDARKEKTNGRLQSIFQTTTSRDLSLLKTNQRAVNAKRTYTPNLNAVRQRPTDKPVESSAKVENKKTRSRGGKHNNNNHVNTRKNPNLHQTIGCFSDGFSSAPHMRASHARATNSRDTNAAAVELQKPRIVNRDSKPEKSVLEHERKTLEELLGDDCDDIVSDERSNGSSDDLRPIEVKEVKSKLVEPNKLDVGSMKIKVEPVDDDVEMASSTGSSDYTGITIKTEPGLEPKTETFQRLDKLFDATPAEFFLFQLPDALPGREPDPVDIKQEHPSTSTAPAAATASKSNSTNLCTLNHLREGRIGRLVRHASGRTRLVIGDISYDMTEGLTSDFTQHAATIYANRQERSANIYNLGEIKSKYNVTPDWNELLERRPS